MPTPEINLGARPYPEALDYLRQRIAFPSNRWDDFSSYEIDAIFFSAGAIDASLVEDLQRLIDRAIEQGIPYGDEDFVRAFDNLAQTYGWDYRGDAAWRANLILKQNLRTAYAAGRYQQQNDPDVARLQPYLQYLHSDAEDPRPNHLALDGMVFRKGDPIVDGIYPPRGYGCGCEMISLSQRQVDSEGLQVSDIQLGDRLPVVIDGESMMTTIEPDPGFEKTPGTTTREERRQIIARAKERLSPEWQARIDREIERMTEGL